ncbi:MAG: RDD family protein [Streptosporangiales bacterium]|nr:RDD family protein [Streptosporangiales bacterium]MBO0891939.1 RDD family protein [Acidothermales bacterium]
MQDGEATNGARGEDAPPTPASDVPLYGTAESAAGLDRVTRTATKLPYGPPPVSQQPARPGQRLAARLLDILVVGVVVLVVQLPMWTAVLSHNQEIRRLVDEYLSDQGGDVQLGALQQALLPWATLSSAVVLLIWFLYEVPLTVRRGQTLGKLLVGIRVTSIVPAGQLSWAAVLGRWAILGLPSMFGFVGMLFQALDCGWQLSDPARRQCLHDKAVGTVVVRAERPGTAG